MAQVDVHTVTMDLQDIAKVEALVEELPDNFHEVGPGTPCIPLCGHASSYRSVASRLHMMCAQIDILVNNAGLALGKAAAHQNDLSDIATMLDTNCKALAILTRSVAAGMVKRDMVRACRPCGCTGLGSGEQKAQQCAAVPFGPCSGVVLTAAVLDCRGTSSTSAVSPPLITTREALSVCTLTPIPYRFCRRFNGLQSQ